MAMRSAGCPPAVESGRTAMMLEVTHRRFPWRRMFLVLGDDEFSLMTERGEILAVASDLPAVLDTIGAIGAATGHAAPRRGCNLAAAM